MNIVIAVSGTGGHLYPALSLAEYARERGDRILFVGNAALVPRLAEKEFPVFVISMSGWKGRKIFALMRVCVGFIASFVRVLPFLRRQKTNVVVGMGGYGAFPVVCAAWLLRIPVVVHEQNCFPGLANRMLSRFATRIALGFSDAATYFPSKKVVVTGNPIRAAFYALDRNAARAMFGIAPEQKVVLVFGGSQGAHGINTLVCNALPLLISSTMKHDIAFIHITGEKDFSFAQRAYHEQHIQAQVFQYYEQMSAAFAAADCVVARAGASTIAELQMVSVPALLIPYPHATDDHQFYNAQYLARYGGAVVYREDTLDVRQFANVMQDILSDAIFKEKAIAFAQALQQSERAEKKLYEVVKQ